MPRSAIVGHYEVILENELGKRVLVYGYQEI